MVYDHALARIREAKTNVSTQLTAADLLAGSSYALRWLGRDEEARRRIEEAFQLLRDAHQYPADTVEPMSRSDHVTRAEADDYAETGQLAKATEAYQELLDKLMAWKPDPLNDLRDATCLSRTWTALANLLRRSGRKDEALQLEAQRTELWNQWKGKLPKWSISSSPIVNPNHSARRFRRPGQALEKFACSCPERPVGLPSCPT